MINSDFLKKSRHNCPMCGSFKSVSVVIKSGLMYVYMFAECSKCKEKTKAIGYPEGDSSTFYDQLRCKWNILECQVADKLMED
jgi:hypothetical protein